MKKLLLFLGILLLSISLQAQSYYWQQGKKDPFYKYLSFSGGVGQRMFFGDVQKTGSLFNKTKLAFDFDARYQWRTRWGFNIHAAGWKYEGLKTFAYPGSEMVMNGSVWQGAAMVQFNILQWVDFNKASYYGFDPVVKFNTYIATGAGGGIFNSSYSSNYVPSQDTLIDNYSEASAGGFGFYVPVEFGVRYRFKPAMHIGMRVQYQLFFTDRLDALERSLDDRMGLLMIRFGYSLGQKKKRR